MRIETLKEECLKAFCAINKIIAKKAAPVKLDLTWF